MKPTLDLNILFPLEIGKNNSSEYEMYGKQVKVTITRHGESDYQFQIFVKGFQWYQQQNINNLTSQDVVNEHWKLFVLTYAKDVLE